MYRLKLSKLNGSPSMAIDVICGMKVREDTDIKTEFKGRTYYFCSNHCKLEFDKNPLKYTR
ncbi:MAG: YHS domain-containing protein [Thermoplasmatales archaeon]